MRLEVSGKNIDVGDALRSHIEDNLTAEVSKYFDRAIEAGAVLSRHGQVFRADISVHASRGLTLHSEAEAENAYLAADGAIARIAKRLRRYKRRFKKHHKAAEAAADAVSSPYYVVAGEPERRREDKQDDDHSPVIIAEEATAISTLTPGEAVMRLDLADAPMLMFHNAAHGGLNVVYRRKDGNIGWVDPQGSEGQPE